MNKLRISKTVNVSNLLFCLYQWLRAEMSPQWQIVLLNTVVHFQFNKNKNKKPVLELLHFTNKVSCLLDGFET